jgi:RNase H-fold protein (predicted Holliday junction resolvase)
LADETLSSHQVKEKLKQLGKNLHPLPQAGGAREDKQPTQHNRGQKVRHASRQGRSKLHQQGQVIDHYAAALILQRWLDER